VRLFTSLRNLFLGLLLGLLSVGVFLALSEVVLKLAKVSPKLDNLHFLLNPELNYPQFFQRDHDLFWRFKPKQVIRGNFMVEGVYQINSLGLRDKEVSEKKPAGVFRLVCLGNSNTFGWRQKQEQAYPQHLQKLFEANRPLAKMEVINGGITGYSSFQGKIFLKKKILKMEPDLVTINYGWNDLLPAKFGIPDKDQKLPSQWVLNLQNLLSQTTLYQLLKSLWVGKLSKPQLVRKGVSRVSLTDYQQNLIEIERICRENKIPVLFLTNPVASIEAYWGPGKTSLVHLMNRAYNNALKELSQTHKLDVLDVAALFLHRGDLYDEPRTDYIHYNVLGHNLIAQSLHDYLVTNRLVLSTANRSLIQGL